MKFTSLFSGSKGNCSLVETEDAKFLIDAGFSFSALQNCLKALCLRPEDIDGIFITHEHTDHVSALPRWTQYIDTPVYVHRELHGYLQSRLPLAHCVPFDSPFEVKGVRVDFCRCSHDAICCCGYRFDDGKEAVASVTDTGVVTEEILRFTANAKTVLIESNHDEDMLKNGGYPYPLKARILSPRGHLSNRQTQEAIGSLIENNVKNIVLGHLSEQNNTRELAFSSALEVFAKKGAVEGRDANLFVASQRKRGETLD